MYHYKSSAELKRMAKGQLLGKYGSLIGALLLYALILIGVMMLVFVTTSANTIFGMVIFYLILFLIQLVMGVFSVGIARLFLNVASQKPHRLTDLFFGFQFHPNKTIIIGFILSVISYLLITPFYILQYRYTSAPSGTLFVAACIALLAGEALVIYISILFSQRYYLMLDLPDYSALQTLQKSRELMKGHKMRYFYISFSFLPLFFLSLLSCGIGLLWVMPYQCATMANFYLDLMEGQNSHTETE